MFNDGITNAFLLRSVTRKGCQLSLLIFNIVLELLITAVKQEKINKRHIQIEKEEIKTQSHLQSLRRKIKNIYIYLTSHVQNLFLKITK